MSSSTRLPRLAPSDRDRDTDSGIPRTAGPSSRTLLSSAAASVSLASRSIGAGTGGRAPATTGRSGALRSSMLTSASTASTRGTGGSLLTSTSSGAAGLTRSVLGKRGVGDAELDDGAASARNSNLYAAQSKIVSLERDLYTARAKHTEQEEKIEAQQAEIWRLKADRSNLADKSGKERKEGEEAQGQWMEERTQKDKTISTINLRLSTLQSTHAAIQSERDQAVGELANLKQSHKRSIATYEDQLQTLQEENAGLKGWQRRATGLSIELEEEKRKYGELEEKMRVVGKGSGGAGGAGAGAGVGDEGGVGHGKEMQRLRDEIKGLSQKLQIHQSSRRALETELTELKKAKKDAEGGKRAQMNMANDLRLELRGVREQLSRAQQDMDSLTRTFPDSSTTPSTPSSELTTLQNRLTTLSDLHKTATESLAAKELELEQLHARHYATTAQSSSSIKELTRQFQEADRELRWAKEGRESAEKREGLIRAELDVLRDTTSRAMPGGGSFGDDAARVSQLEKVVELYKQQLDEMQRDSQEAEERIVQEHGLVKQAVLDEVQALLKEKLASIAAQEARIAELEAANATLDAEVSDAARRLASGEYDPAKMRVIEFANNPAARIKMTRLAELQELKEENEALLQALSELEDSKGLSNDDAPAAEGHESAGKRYVPRQSFERLVKEKKELEESREKRVLRLKEIFGAKSKEFLEAVYSLLGWKIKFDESGRDIRLTSMYAPKGKMGLTLKFASNEGHFGTMQMTGAMAKGLEEARHFWIIERQSVPGFLAQVTTECFEKTTIGRASGYVGLE